MDRRGFTLMELLVVIAIIAVLISLSIVALGGGRHASRTLQCLTQLRQVGTALEAMRDRDGLLPSMRLPIQPLTKRTMMEMGFEFTARWYAALGATLTPSSDTRLTSSGWPVWNTPRPWRCPQDDPAGVLVEAMMSSAGYDTRWSVAAQIGTSYYYIGIGPSFSPLMRANADEMSVRRVLTRAAELCPREPLVSDNLPFHKQTRGLIKAHDTNGYFGDGSASPVKFELEENPITFYEYVHSQFFKK